MYWDEGKIRREREKIYRYNFIKFKLWSSFFRKDKVNERCFFGGYGFGLLSVLGCLVVVNVNIFYEVVVY